MISFFPPKLTYCGYAFLLCNRFENNNVLIKNSNYNHLMVTVPNMTSAA